MDDSLDKLTGGELGVYMGILSGIAMLQSTGQFLWLLGCPIIGLAFGKSVDWITQRLNWHLGWTEEE